MIILIIHIIVSYNQNISLIFLCERWIPCQAVTSVLCLLFRPKTVHCSTKNMYTSEITFLELVSWRNMFSLTVWCTNTAHRIGYCIHYTGKKRRLNAKQTHFLGYKSSGNTDILFYHIKNRFIWYGIVKKHILKIKRRP